MANMGIRVHIIGRKRSQRSRDGSTSQNTFHELYKLCAKFHAFIKKCTIFGYVALLKGTWTFLENSIFVFIVEHFQLHSIESSVENIAKAFNEIQTLSNSFYNSVYIPDNIMKPTEKSINQIRSKLQHYLKEMTAKDIYYVVISSNSCAYVYTVHIRMSAF